MPICLSDIPAEAKTIGKSPHAIPSFRLLTSPVWLTEALYGLVASCAWATQVGRVAPMDFTHMITELLLGGALRREES